jgi:hypothetical protein
MRNHQGTIGNPYSLPHALYNRTVAQVRDNSRPEEGRGGEYEAIHQALATLPREYRSGVWGSVVFRDPYPFDADERTYRTWKQRFIHAAAANLKQVQTS